jgi:hypothetical protein
MKVQMASPDLALCHVSTEQCGVRALCTVVFNIVPPIGESECRRSARIAQVPVSKTGLDQVLGGKDCGLRVQSPTRICAVSYLRRVVQRHAVHAKAGHPCAAPDCFACSEPIGRAGASIKLGENHELCKPCQEVESTEQDLLSNVRRPTTAWSAA